ncbi:MAG: hypothetical protein AAB225_23230, partial [Acidobacteriota bacterium]
LEFLSAGEGQMPPEQNNATELTSWKEIADHLRVNIRTAQRWEEERRLPVHRLGGERGRVVAWTAELDRWKKAAIERTRWWNNARLLRIYALALSVVVAIGAVLGSIFLARIARKGPPQTYYWKDRSLVTLDSAGREAWRYDFPETVDPHAPIGMWIGDLDGDRSVETVAPYRPVLGGDKPMDLRCLSEQGKLRWRFAPQRKVRDRSREYAPVYHLRRFRVFPSPESKDANWVAASFVHHWGYPCQVAVLDNHGRLRGEYWHSGHFDDLETADLDGDGVHEILLGGVNNGRQQAVLVVLDPRKVSGCSTQAEGDAHQLLDLPSGTEKAIVWFPRTSLNRKLEQFNFAYEVAVIGDEIKVQVKERMGDPQPFLIYVLDRGLNVKSVVPSETMRNFYLEMKASGKLDQALSDAELDRLRREVRVIRKQ